MKKFAFVALAFVALLNPISVLATDLSVSSGSSLSDATISNVTSNQRVYLLDNDATWASTASNDFCGFDGATSEGYNPNGKTVDYLYYQIRGASHTPGGGNDNCSRSTDVDGTWYVKTLNDAQTDWVDSDTFTLTIPPSPTASTTITDVVSWGFGFFWFFLSMFAVLAFGMLYYKRV